MSENQQQVKVSKVGRKFAIGYQIGGEMTSDDLIDIISRYRESILEVYFAMPGDMSGRAPAGMTLEQMKLDELMEAFKHDLDRLKALDVRGVMLFNSACYGKLNQSKKLFDHVAESIETVMKHIDLKAITTLHPGIAEFVKSHYPDLKIRSSVTMQIGTIQQMEAVAEQFDGFYLHRDFNRDLEHIKTVRKWCDAHGKTLHLLANSGCLYECPFHMIHMSHTAHYEETTRMSTIYENNRPSPCCDVYVNPDNLPVLLQNTWIRPEDLPKVSGYFETIKLASRISPNIKDIVKGYCEGEWHGNLLKLCEMDYSIMPFVPKIMNDKFPDGWFEQTMHCGHHCDSCGYCKKILAQVSEKPDVTEKKEG
jgi:collagenase-like PrtC family protease